MSEVMKMTQLLDEKDFLKQKILKDITNLDLATVKRKMDEKCKNGDTTEEFEAKAKSAYQSITDNIDRYNRICAAIVQSNAETEITVSGRTMSRAKAIELRKQLRGRGNLETTLINKLGTIYTGFMSRYEDINDAYNRNRNEFTNNMIATSGGDKNKALSEESNKIIESLSDPYIPVKIDPLNIGELFNNKKDEIENFVKEIESAIKISNAITDVEF